MIKAIETQYKGCRFRSRLEARWAVFFDAMGWNWEYEPEGFELGGGVKYLPDFKITLSSPEGLNFELWYEIKPTNAADDGKMFAFQQSLPNGRGGVLAGDPFEYFGIGKKEQQPSGPITRACPRCGDLTQEQESVLCGDYEYIYCYRCDMETPCGGDNESNRGAFGCLYKPHKGWMETPSPYYSLFVNLPIEKAAIKARSARFEHGETPQ